MPVLTAEQLRKIGIDVFKALGASEEEANIVSGFLVKSNLAGHDSHGVIRIVQYTNSIQKRRINPGAIIEVVRETPSSALLNGNWGFGQVVGIKAMEMAIEKAEKNTVGVICVYNCNHVGRLADYTLMAAERGMIGMAMANSVRGVAPFGGIERLLSTGPLSYAFPTRKETPFVLDIATSICAEGKIRVSLHNGERLPEKWIIDKNGDLSDNPPDYYDGGAILPFGGGVGHKGFGLGIVVDVLSGLLARSGPAYSSDKRGNGLFIEAINIEDFISIDQFFGDMDKLITTLKKSKPMAGVKEILIPGEPEIKSEQRRLKNGIFVPDKTWKEIVETAKQVGVDIDPNLG